MNFWREILSKYGAILMAIAAGSVVTGPLTVPKTLIPPQRNRADEIFPPLCAVWPPLTVTLVAFKQERRLEAWADGRLLKTYPILAASGGPGLKRREGDRQVPEGIYRLTTLNPQSRFHLSVRVDYPDAEDRANGCTGSDIYVHGGAASIGCLAIGNSGIEEIYRLAQLVDDRRILILPWDFRRRPPPDTEERWVADRYARLEKELEALR